MKGLKSLQKAGKKHKSSTGQGGKQMLPSLLPEKKFLGCSKGRRDPGGLSKLKDDMACEFPGSGLGACRVSPLQASENQIISK